MSVLNINTKSTDEAVSIALLISPIKNTEVLCVRKYIIKTENF